MPTSLPLSRSPQRSQIPASALRSLGYPAIFHWTILVVLLGLFVLAAFKQMVPLLAGTALLLVLPVMAWFWSRYALRNLALKVSTSHGRAFPGENIEVTLELVNKGLPLPWLEVEMELPYRLATGKRSPSPYTRERLRWTTAISPGQVITWKQTLEARARGDYLLGPLRLRSGDMFGLLPKEMVLPEFESLLVYPRILAPGKLNLPMKALLGEKVGPRSFYQDTSRVAGARDYQNDDPFKHVHWKASAAHGKLQTRLYESSTSLSLLLILDVTSFPEEDEEFEQAVSTAASLAYEADRLGFAVGLMANSAPEVQIPIRTGRTQVLKILEALARITAKPGLSLNQQLDRLRTLLPAGSTLLVITRTVTPVLAGFAREMEKNGHILQLVSVDQVTEQSEKFAAFPGKEACA